jgi:aryl-alcohol dehydrogenase-like predicted oxidoreductase
MQMRPLGLTGLSVSALGLGAMQVGSPALAESRAAELLNVALDLGINFVDTARAYGLAEERIGRHLAHRRREFLLATKVGYGVDGVADWTYDSVVRGVDAACRRLRTDWIDVVQLHSCDVGTLREGGVIEALERCVADGKVRIAGYSGENDALDWAMACGRLGTLQLSLNICDQGSLDRLPIAKARGLGIIVKRAFAEWPWRRTRPPPDPPAAEYFHRFNAMFPVRPPLDWPAVALRFAAFAPGVDVCLVGTTQAAHLAKDARALEQGPLEKSQRELLEKVFAARGERWRGVI